MARRAILRSSISFGLVSIPVGLHPENSAEMR
jgi:non-homologous end joining protein Ku